MTETPWAHLPNAVHIDCVIASLEANPEKWSKAWSKAWSGAWDAAYTAADGARSEAWDAAYTAARSAAAAQDAVAALVAWDDCAYMLDMPEDALKVLCAVGSQPAVLLSVAAKVLRAENI